MLDTDTRLRVGRAIGKTEEQVAHELMTQLKDRGHLDAPPAMATDGKDDYRQALVDTWAGTGISWGGPTTSHQARSPGVAVSPSCQYPGGESPDWCHDQGDLR